MKRLATVLGILLLSGTIASPVLAHGRGYGAGYGMGPGMGWYRGAGGNWGAGPGSGWAGGGTVGTLTGEQRDKLDTLYQKFRDDTAQVRSDLWNKAGELNALLNSENPDPAKVKALEDEISGLRAKLAQAGIDLRLAERKIAPAGTYSSGYGPGYGRGYGPGMWGYGRHMMGWNGPGMMGYGYPNGYPRGGYGWGMMGRGWGMMGPGMMGRGWGMMGPGWYHMGGYGPGACWD